MLRPNRLLRVASPLPPSRADEGSPAVESWRFSVLEFSLATTPLDELEKVSESLGDPEVARLFEAHHEIEELGAIRTCHRVELLVLDRQGDPMEWRASLPGTAEGWRVWSGAPAVHHLHRVAAGLESLAPGEREVRDQIERSVGAVRSRHPRPVVAELLHLAVTSARTLDTPLSTRRSIAGIASTRVLDEVAKPFPRVVVVGTGAVGRQVTESLGPYARITMVYRTSPPPDDFLRITGARAVPLVDLPQEARLADGIVATAKTGERILSAADLAGREEGLVVVDLGLPRNVDPAVGSLPRVHLVNLEDLYQDSGGVAPAAPLEAAVASSALRSWGAIEPWLYQPWIDQLMRGAEELRRAEVGRAASFLSSLSPSQRAAVEHLTRRLTERLLRAPLERLRSLPAANEHDEERALALRLWGRAPREP